MIREFLWVEWERRRGMLLLVTALYAAVPLMYLALLGGVTRPGAGGAQLVFQVDPLQLTGLTLVLGVVLSAFAWGAGSWGDERRGGWVYALALPIQRTHLFALRYLAGLAWLALPLLALTALSFVAAAVASVPTGMYAYPGSFSSWAALVSWFLYTLAFVLSARFEHPWRIVAIAAAVLLVAATVPGFGVFPGLSRLVELVAWGGVTPLRVFWGLELPFGS
ncbi:MAG: hypothetical protein JO040_10780 [Gemmatimonadetes bacterium]|nr:hypothetical protein [Gemmatimonadota bacterium]